MFNVISVFAFGCRRNKEAAVDRPRSDRHRRHIIYLLIRLDFQLTGDSFIRRFCPSLSLFSPSVFIVAHTAEESKERDLHSIRTANSSLDKGSQAGRDRRKELSNRVSSSASPRDSCLLSFPPPSLVLVRSFVLFFFPSSRQTT